MVDAKALPGEEEPLNTPYPSPRVPHAFLTRPPLACRRAVKKGVCDMVDLIMVVATVVFFVVSFALVKWFERI